MPVPKKQPIPPFNQARLEAETDDLEEFVAEIPLRRDDAQGAEIVSGREVHDEPPQRDRAYRNLNE
ncbi:hypothetical protein J7643_11550 [bacterium]|nr:hypothetical protein [bacterium]